MLELISNHLGVVVTTFAGIIFVRYILNQQIKFNRFYMILLVILNSFIIEILYSLEVGMARSIIGYFLYVILFKVVFKLSTNKSFLSAFIFYVLLFTSEIFMFFIITYVFKNGVEYIRTIVADKLWSNTLVSILILCISYCFRTWLIKLSNIKIKINVLTYWCLSFMCIILFFFLAFKTDTLNIGTYFALGTIIIMLVIIFSLFMQAYKNDQLTIKYDKMLEFIKKYEVEIDNQRMLRHETKNQLLTIKSKLIDDDKQENMVKYIDEIIKDNNSVINHSEYAKLRYLPSNGIKGLFYFKVSEALDKKISVNISISRNIENSFIKNLSSNTFNQFGKILGIFLDNAIEGASEASQKEIGIEIYSDDGDIHFIISNTFTSKITSKGYGRGHGLLLARTIIDSNNSFVNATEVTDDLYVQKLVIKK